MTSLATKPTLLLIDGSNLAFRMFFALEMTNLRDLNGNPTWAVYGTLKALFDAIEFAKPDHCAVAFDLPEPSFRHELFVDYKANRPDEMPDDLKAQWPVIKDGFAKFHIPVLEEAGFEADDIIGIMAKKAEKENYNVVILSGDKDLFQLVTERVSIAVPQRGGGLEIYTPEHVLERMGVRPDQVPDYKGIAGDSSDNIPGVRGLGPKAATNLLTAYNSLEEIYQNIDKVTPPKTKEKLVEQEENARLSKYLATIIVDPDAVKTCNLSLTHCRMDMPDTDNLIEFLKLMEFNSILRRLPEVLKPFNNGNLAEIVTEKTVTSISTTASSTTVTQTQTKFIDIDTPLESLTCTPVIVTTLPVLKDLVNELKAQKTFAIDLETDGLNTLSCNIAGIAIAFSDSHKAMPDDDEIKLYYIPTMHQDLEHIPLEDVIRELKVIIEDPDKLQIIQNAKFEQKIFMRHGWEIHSNFFDTMLASYVANASSKHGLKAQGKRIFHQRMQEIEEIIGVGRKQITIDQADINEVASYAATDALITYKLYFHYLNSLDVREMKLLNEIEFPLIAVLRDIELVGISLDTEFLKNLSVEVNGRLKEIEAEVFAICEETFNISSPRQLSAVIFEKLKIEPIGKRNKTGAFSTDSETLETLLYSEGLSEKQKGLILLITEYRTLSKLASTYIDNLPTLIAKEDSRLHSDFNQVVTATGRLSSSNPNLQNIPIKTEYGRKVRRAFIPLNDEYLILSADYSQIELRLLADMANEKALIEAFKRGEDVHKRTAMEIFGISETEVTEDLRRIGKTLNFALIYMQGPFATAKQLGIEMREAKEFIEKYFNAFKNIKPYMDTILKEAHQNEFVETKFGRRRYFQNINSPNKILVKEEERQAFNAVLQGTAADILKIAMINLYEELKEKSYKSRITLQVHDELVLEVYKPELEAIKTLVIEKMSAAAQLQVPLTVDVGVGANWLDL